MTTIERDNIVFLSQHSLTPARPRPQCTRPRPQRARPRPKPNCMVSDRSCPKTDGLRPSSLQYWHSSSIGTDMDGLATASAGKPRFSNKNTLGFF